jgi:hypothetical protein
MVPVLPVTVMSMGWLQSIGRCALPPGRVRCCGRRPVRLPFVGVWVYGNANGAAVRLARIGGGTYRYEVPRFGYSALLEVDPTGFVTRYPELWGSES